MASMIYTSVADLDFRVDALPTIEPPSRVLLTTPDHFDVQYVINPHMAGNVGTVDFDAAVRQWNAIRTAYTSLGLSTHLVEGQPGMPDMVFCANQTLPYRLPDGTLGIVPSRMHAPERAREVQHYELFFKSIGYVVESLPTGIPDFEGMGDALWHTRRFLLCGGYGFRSSMEAYYHLSSAFDLKVVVLRLDDPDFYHLDTCLSIINESTALIFPGAFDENGLQLIRSLFSTVLEAPETEARSLFACNAHSPDGHNVLIQAGCVETVDQLRNAGLHPVEVDTTEYLKAGGSVFCLKQMFW